MKKFILILLATLSFSICGFAQNAQKVSEILESNEISKAQASYFVCVYQNFASETVEENQAFEILTQKNLFKSQENPQEKISLSKSCYLIAKSSQMKGGIFYSIFKSPRYAFREFKALKIVPQNADPNQKVSGSELIALLNGFEKKSQNKR